LFSCGACGTTGECVYRYILSSQIIDSTGTLWVSLFGDQGDTILNNSAAHIAQLKAENSDT